MSHDLLPQSSSEKHDFSFVVGVDPSFVQRGVVGNGGRSVKDGESLFEVLDGRNRTLDEGIGLEVEDFEELLGLGSGEGFLVCVGEEGVLGSPVGSSVAGRGKEKKENILVSTCRSRSGRGWTNGCRVSLS